MSNPLDLIGGVGGNRYGWFDYNQFSTLAFDNARLDTSAAIPEPSSLMLLGIAGVLGSGLLARRRRGL